MLKNYFKDIFSKNIPLLTFSKNIVKPTLNFNYQVNNLCHLDLG